MAPDISCLHCEEPEPVEHLPHGCENDLAKLWALAGCALILVLFRHTGDYIPSMNLTFWRLFIPNLTLYSYSSSGQQDREGVKCNIIFWGMFNL
jgi:hypothetical protein